MIFSPTPLMGSYIINVSPNEDSRGWFARVYCKNEFEQIGHQDNWVQVNHSFSVDKGTLRGMHYQHEPYGEIKMVRCIAGSVYDVIVDLRKESNTYLQWFGVELSAKNRKAVYIPKGFAHGFQTLEGNSELLYFHSAFYNPVAEAGLKYNDPSVNISWPLPVTVISERDEHHPYLN